MTYELDALSNKIALLDRYVKDSVFYIKKNWNIDGGCPGDHPGADSNSWSTASCVYLLTIIDESKSKQQVEGGIIWLLDCQNMNGSFPVMRRDKDQPTHEYAIPSVFAMIAFYEYSTRHPENDKIKAAFEKVVHYILKNKKTEMSKNGEEMHSWCFQKGLESSTITTATVIRYLHQVLNYFEGKADQVIIQQTIDGGKNWLLQAFKSNNKWGINPNDVEKKELPTAYSILALQECGFISKEVMQAISFLKSKQKEDGAWSDYFEYEKLTGFGLGTEVSFYFSTPI